MSSSLCPHYQRGCDIQCAECSEFVACRLCHDDADHTLPRSETHTIQCRTCSTTQPVSNACINEECGMTFGRYFCAVCRMWENNPSKDIYHCQDCGICRVGKGLGLDYFHCKTCGCCLNLSLKDTHVCIENTLKQHCPVCMEDMHNSTDAAFISQVCGHAMHNSCFKEYLRNGRYKCPMCNKPMIDLEKLMREAEEKDMKEEEEEDLNGNPCINTRRWKRRGETCKRMCMYYGFTYILYPLLMLLAMLFHYAQILWHRVFVGDNGNNNDNHHAINGAGGRVFNLHGRGLIIDDINIDDGDMDEDFVLVDGDSDDSDSEDGAIDDAVDDSDEPGDGGLRRRR